MGYVKQPLVNQQPFFKKKSYEKDEHPFYS